MWEYYMDDVRVGTYNRRRYARHTETVKNNKKEKKTFSVHTSAFQLTSFDYSRLDDGNEKNKVKNIFILRKQRKREKVLNSAASATGTISLFSNGRNEPNRLISPRQVY